MGRAVTDHVAAVHVVSGQVGQGAVSSVLALHAHGLSARTGGAAGVDAAAGLHAGFLIRVEHALVLAERLAVEDLGVQVEHPGGFEDEVRVPREDPRPVLPRL